MTLYRIRNKWSIGKSLNPCFSGIYCDFLDGHLQFLGSCLNPCFSGIYCDIKEKQVAEQQALKGLNPCFSGIYCDLMAH